MKHLIYFFLIILHTSLLHSLENDLQQLNLTLQKIINTFGCINVPLPPAILPSLPLPPITPTTPEFKLVALTEDEQAAGVIGNQYYNTGKLDFTTLHREGHTIDKSFLKNFFFYSIFQNYIYRFLNYDMRFNYQEDLLKEDPSLEKWRSLSVNFGLGLLLKGITQKQYDNLSLLIQVIPHALDAFKKNKLLENLGIAYQRMKIVVEKLANQLTINPDEVLVRALYAADRIATDLQTMIFHFMKEGMEKYQQQFRSAKSDEEKINAGNFLETFTPVWIEKPYYKKIIENINNFMQPQKSYVFQGREFQLI